MVIVYLSQSLHRLDQMQYVAEHIYEILHIFSSIIEMNILFMARFQAILNLERESRRTDKRSIYNDINLSVHTVGKWKNIL